MRVGASRAGSSPLIEQLTKAPVTDRRESVWHSLGIVVAFAAGGAVWGVVARSWMRLITEEPEFTWSGTLFIVGLFTIAATVQGCALAVRRRRWPRWAQAPVRVLAGAVALLLGAGAGMIMLPTLVCGPLAIGRTTWRRGVRVGLAAIAGANAIVLLPMLLGELSVARASAGWLAMLVVYGVIITVLSLNLRPLRSGTHITPALQPPFA